MRKRVHKLIMTVFAITMCFHILSGAVSAAEISTGEMKVISDLTGDHPSNEEYVIKMKADDYAYPMPEGSLEGEYTLTIKGESIGVFPSMTYTKVGNYSYTIWQEKGTNKKCTYDNSKYHLMVTVLNAEAGEGFEIISILQEEGKSEKLNEIKFENRYPDKPKPLPEESTEPEIYPYMPVAATPTKTGDSSNIMVLTALMTAAIAGVVCIHRKYRYQ